MERQTVHATGLDPVGESIHVKIGANIRTGRHGVIIVKQAMLGLVHVENGLI